MVDNDDPIMVRQIINAAGYDTETGIYGVGYSPDNGKSFYVQNTSAGRKFRQQDADGLWPFLKDKIGDIKNGSLNVTWNDIQNKPDVALKSDIPDVSNLNKVITVTSGTLADLANKNGTYHYEIDCSPTDAPVADWGLCDVVVGEHYAKQTFTNTGNKSGDSYLRIRDYDGEWSDWREVTLWQ